MHIIVTLSVCVCVCVYVRPAGSSFLYVCFRLHSARQTSNLKAGKIVRICDEEVKSGDKTQSLAVVVVGGRKEEANLLYSRVRTRV